MEFFLVINKQTQETCILEGFEETRELDTRIWEISPIKPTEFGVKKPLTVLKVDGKKKKIFTLRDLEGIYV